MYVTIAFKSIIMYHRLKTSILSTELHCLQATIGKLMSILFCQSYQCQLPLGIVWSSKEKFASLLKTIFMVSFLFHSFLRRLPESEVEDENKPMKLPGVLSTMTGTVLYPDEESAKWDVDGMLYTSSNLVLRLSSWYLTIRSVWFIEYPIVVTWDLCSDEGLTLEKAGFLISLCWKYDNTLINLLIDTKF